MHTCSSTFYSMRRRSAQHSLMLQVCVLLVDDCVCEAARSMPLKPSAQVPLFDLATHTLHFHTVQMPAGNSRQQHTSEAVSSNAKGTGIQNFLEHVRLEVVKQFQ